ncbi:archaeal proteasome endopeptidase complex subunit beta [Methanosalsum natronophilum]|uniref:Proteasome subunit beta n=1 Tax=Methanosalsum natronophilum TaxID=768733 RepID=A0A3R7YJ96_9EURY|nr:archaeal proteasome endopeptidase complex subunit beta [Methanosalsum natronophilum]MCS3924264.1 proteasome beta subunit [Methanosalsum natronophilum]RQD89293.1 MAG: archaeal proteasome endopeptidase complex subunit beta [Methanosalsum natronophilum]
MVDDKHLKGTTTVGIVCKDGVVLATEKRATMGHLIASKTAKKIYQIDDLVGLTTAGSVGDAQQIVRLISVESRLYKMRRQESMTIKGITTLLSNVLSGQRYYPLMVQLLIGGVDKKGPNLYSLDALGGVIEETKSVATGSGSPIAYGVLEDRYHEDMAIDEGAELAIRALHNAMKRDSASGNSIDVVCITSDGYSCMEESAVNEKIQSLN